MDLWGDSPFFELEYWNSQHMLFLCFRAASQNLSSFRQLLFSQFPRGDQRKNTEKPVYSFGNFSTFFLCSPLGNCEKKVVYMSSNFEMLHEIINQAYAENFSILTQKMVNPLLNPSLHFLIGIPFSI